MSDQTAPFFNSVQLQMQNASAQFPDNGKSVAVTIQPDGLLIQKQSGQTAKVNFDQVSNILPMAYQLEIRLLNRDRFLFSHLGYDYDAFVYQVFMAWNVFVSDAMFVDEHCLIETRGDYSYTMPANPLLKLSAISDSDQHGDNRFRIYDSSLMILPVRAPIRRIPICFIRSVQRNEWYIEIATDHGEQVKLSRLGYDTEPMLKAINDALQRQIMRAHALLQQVLAMLEVQPAEPLDEQNLMAAASQLREGRAADWRTLEKICPGLTAQLELLLRQWLKGGNYQFLTQIAAESGIDSFALGIRREQPTDTLRDSSASDDAEIPQDADQPEIPAFWIAVPASGSKSATIVEVIAEKPLAQATYLFTRDSDPAQWPLNCQILNQGLEAVDFRRQPIYFALDKLHQPEYRKDFAALRFCPSLQYLRNSFIKRVIHQNPDQWQAAVHQVLTDTSQD